MHGGEGSRPAPVVQHADQPPLDAPPGARPRDDGEAARAAGRSSSPCRWGARPTSRTSCSSRTICSSSFPELARLKERCDALKVRLWPGTTSATSGRTSRSCAGTTTAATAAPAARGSRRSASRRTAPSRGARRCRPRAGRGVTSATRRSSTSGSASEPLRYMRERTTRGPLGLLRDLLLRARVPERLHVDELRHARQAREQPVLPPPRARARSARGSASASCRRRWRRASRSITASSRLSSSRFESTEAGPTTIPAPPMDASHHEALQGPR